MVRDRSDWCISRQRTWGVPIPIVYCNDCHKPIIDERIIDAISELFRKEGSDAWYTRELTEFIPDTVKCECGCSNFTKEMDIMDVWFDSGVTHAAVMDERGLGKVADLYLEGADQYRGWFQSSLLTSVVWQGTAPYKAVCTHGWVVDGEGKTMHKSAGNGIEPKEIIKDFGADILRLWVASSDYHSDIRISKEILKQLSDSYKKIRNTARFILGNLDNGNGFDFEKDSVEDKDLMEIDKWAIMKLDELIEKVNKSYDDFDYHIVFHSIHSFCVVYMSNFYLDIIKDRLYCEDESSIERRSAQTVMYKVLSSIARLIAPIMSFTADEIWSFMPHASSDNTESIFLNEMPEKSGIILTDEFKTKWDIIYKLREDAKKALEIKRAEKVIGASLEAKVTVFADTSVFDSIVKIKNELSSIFIVSDVDVINGGTGDFKGEYESVSMTVEKATGAKCERCWVYSESVGKDSNHPTLCERCVKVIK